MPVEDHAVHEKTVQKEGFRYEACQGKFRFDVYQTRSLDYTVDGLLTRVPMFVLDTSSQACRYMDYKHDSGCTGCLQPKDMDYIEKMRGLL